MDQETAFLEQSQHIGFKISSARRLVGITQQELADRLGVSKQAISKLEQTETVDDKRLEKISNALGVSMEGLKKFRNDNVLHTTNNFYENCGVTATNVGSTNVENLHQFSIEQAKNLFEELIKMEREKFKEATSNKKSGTKKS